ncbi:xanthine dehydrogenase family protein molybdopterin-binding subunit [Anaerobacillus alkaliphilus]|uniref:Xanthine dehydrogenase family protein molybdopterin-binding subunit n=1 Tax=Anaerobacillus alkaliphilus TaxID=1548597 RepID=A0A4Q0VTD6_9BACI|nr:xanthine dehydrogenase family protein molybdopterin-binding subunit [Anaerobacillus alkaliphilus]RXJ00688.1 xanthine dehydrogenase family protein molybdopterin-binding subunit [Anaerobacillus alkaliphilus]
MKNIGKSVIRKEANDKVTGKAKYTADFHSPSMLHGRLVISKYGHAKISAINTEDAWAIPGVRAIIVGSPGILTGEEIKDRPPIAVGKVRYYGEVVAMVVADTEAIASKAASLVKVTYEPLPVVQTPSDAVKEGAALIHEKMLEYEREPHVHPFPNTNIVNQRKIRKGDVGRGWSESTYSVEEFFSIPTSDHIAMEPRASIAEIKDSGEIHITTSSQGPHMVKKLLSTYFDINVGKIVVHTPLVGGGFGGKASVQLEILAYMASKEVGGRPVKIVNTREEDMVTSPSRMGLDAVVKIGCNAAGMLTVAELTYLVDTGAYADKGIHLSRASSVDCTGPYHIENIWCDSYAVYTNHPYPAPFRGFSHTEVHFVFERAMDILAKKIGMDPLEFRYQNAIKPGDRTPTQTLLNHSNIGNLRECIDRVKVLSNWEQGQCLEVNERTVRTKAISCLWKNSTIPTNSSSGVILTFNEDGTVNLLSGVIEIGTGTKTVLAQILAERMKMSVEDIHVRMEVDTQTTPEHWKTVASRGVLMAGRAAIAAADDAICQIKEIASCVLRARMDDLEVANKKVFVRSDPTVSLDFQDVVYGYTYPNGNAIGGQIIARGNYVMRQLTHLDEETGAGKPGPEWSVGAQVIELEFDCRDFTYRVLRAITVLDAGKVLNYHGARGQVTGSISMGLGYAAREGFIFDEFGKILNPRIRTNRPLYYGEEPIEYIVDFVETPHLDGPFGARGVGEQGLIGIPAALANSLSLAAGVELNHLPLTPELIWQTKEESKLDSF